MLTISPVVLVIVHRQWTGRTSTGLQRGLEMCSSHHRHFAYQIPIQVGCLPHEKWFWQAASVELGSLASL